MSNFLVTRRIPTLEDGQKITFTHRCSYTKGEGHSLHLNDYIEIYVYVKGDADFVVDDTYYNLSRGDILLITPYEAHVVVIKEDCDYERFYLLLPVKALSSYKYNLLSKLLKKEKGISAKIPLDEKNRAKCLELLYEISRICEAEASGFNDMLVYSLILQFLCIVNSTIDTADNKGDEGMASLPTLLKDILLYINDKPTEINSVSDIADKFHISLPYLSSLFKKNMGVSPSAFLKTKKIAHAKRLLEEGNSVTYACYESGFNDCSYFIKVFKSLVGVTPHKYLNNR